MGPFSSTFSLVYDFNNNQRENDTDEVITF